MICFHWRPNSCWSVSSQEHLKLEETLANLSSDFRSIRKLQMSNSYLLTCDQKSSPNEKPRYSLSSGRHEEYRLLRSDHWADGCPRGVGSLRDHSDRKAWRESIGRVVSQPIRQALVSPQELIHL